MRFGNVNEGVKKDFQEVAKEHVVAYFNVESEHTETYGRLHPEEVYVVWFCYILGGWKALLSTTVPDDMYYEVTYNKINEETYLDAYKKVDNRVLPD